MINFLFISNLIEEKGILVLLDACYKLKEKQLPFLCHLVGAETKTLTAQVLQKIINSKQLQDVTKYYGPIFGTDKESIYKASDVMVFPTFYHNECFPLVILEGMKHRLPIISTHEGAIPDMILNKKNGVLIERQNATALATAMEQFIQHPHLVQEMGNFAFQHYNDNFTENIFINNIIDILSK
ncbi:MAG: glycosyltransferase family 4 protein [Akkermansiaceae bacterium]|nr:glycosyltransferase family 4 protein [Akkermansiaceae bacterium]